MAQICNKNNQSSANTFDGHKMFVGSAGAVDAKEATYLGVLNMFRKVFKNITNSDLFA